MRLDEFVGESISNLIKVYHNNTATLLFDINNSRDYSKLKGYMKNYEVCCYDVVDKCAIVYVKERKND